MCDALEIHFRSFKKSVAHTFPSTYGIAIKTDFKNIKNVLMILRKIKKELIKKINSTLKNHEFSKINIWDK